MFNMYVKTKIAMRIPAGVRSLHTSQTLQRLNAGDLTYAYLVGLFEGDGWFTVSKKGKYLLYEIGIEMSIRDVQLIYKIKNLLGVGMIGFRTRNGIETVYLRIRNKDHLKNFILPIFDKYPMFTNKLYDYLNLKTNLLSGLIYSEDLVKYVRSDININTVDSILACNYFSAWLVGFIEAEGCFSSYELNTSGYLVCSFDISQKYGEIIIASIIKYLSFTVQPFVDKTNCSKLKVTSVRSIENVINFLEKAPVKLLGHKKSQFLSWIKILRTIPRYANKIKLPLKY